MSTRVTSMRRTETLIPLVGNGHAKHATKNGDYAAEYAAIGRSQAVIEFQMDGTILHANENFLSAMGYSLEEVKGKHHGMFVEEAYRSSGEYREFWAKLNRGEFVAGEFKRVAKGGREVWIQASYNPILDSTNKPYKVVKFASDITKQKVANADFTAQIAAIGKSQAVIEFQMDGMIMQANENFLKTLGYSLDEIKGKHHSMFVDSAYRTSNEYREFWAKLNRGEYVAGEFKRIGRAGNEIWISASYNPILDLNGKPCKVVKFASDVTERKSVVDKVAVYLDRVSKGDIPTKITDNYSGDFNVIKNNLNTVIDNVNALVADAEMLAKAAGEGNLSTRADASRHQGKYRQMIEGVNQTLDSVVVPLRDVSSSLGQMAKGDLTAAMTATYVGDFKALSDDVNAVVKQVRTAIQKIAENTDSLVAASEELTATSRQMNTNADETSAQSAVVAQSSEQVSRNLQTVATATEEMGATIKEIAKNTTESARIASEAVSTAQSTNVTVTKLGESSAEIGHVIKVITSIAQQTNLLALNATIEAARAGEAGKGFAVVANEVKELAKQTAKATEDISRKIEAIQTDSKGAVEAIAAIGGIIGKVNEISNTIATAVQEQDVTTNEMTRSVTEAARGAGEIAKNIVGVTDVAKSTSHGASDTFKASQELAKLAGQLHELTTQFKY
jgi:methyl-accepting chemotaxis protein